MTLASGDRGSFPAAAHEPDGTLVVAYNIGSGSTVGVGVVALKAGAATPSVETNADRRRRRRSGPGHVGDR